MKVKRIRKFNFKKFFKFLLFLCVLIFLFITLSKVTIKNIIVKGNNVLSDELIIETANIEDYPSFLKTLTKKIEKKVSSLPMVKDVKVKKKWGYKVLIEVEEYVVLFQIRSTNEYVLKLGKKVNNLNIDKNVAVLINYVPDDIMEKTIKKFSLLEENVLVKISEIEYTPTTYDNERFLLYMNDGNEVYITLNKIKEFNNYNKIKGQIGTKKGILYLDSGNYFEIKE